MKRKRTRMFRWQAKQAEAQQVLPALSHVQHSRTKFRYRPRPARRLRIGRAALVTVLAAGLLFGLVRLIVAGVQLIASRRIASELETLYQTQTALPSQFPGIQTPDVSLLPKGSVAETQGPFLAVSPSPAPVAVVTIEPPVPTATLPPRLSAISYPDNPQRRVNLRFQTLQLENPDIVGWLTIDKMLSEAVVQRDNVFYLNHNAKGKENVNGALFLDAAVSLKKRPYTLLVYGHNMKSGAMFGNLQNYDNASFYRANPFITFDSMYEEGHYVVFAEGMISMNPEDDRYVNFFAFTTARTTERQQMINTLINCSAFSCEVDVRADDQLLILVTCTGDDTQRRILAARRVRDEEVESELKVAVSHSNAR